MLHRNRNTSPSIGWGWLTFVRFSESGFVVGSLGAIGLGKSGGSALVVGGVGFLLGTLATRCGNGPTDTKGTEGDLGKPSERLGEETCCGGGNLSGCLCEFTGLESENDCPVGFAPAHGTARQPEKGQGDNRRTSDDDGCPHDLA